MSEGFLEDDAQVFNLNELECGHGNNDPHVELCEGREFDIVHLEKGIIEATCKKCGSKYRLTPEVYHVDEIKNGKGKRR